MVPRPGPDLAFLSVGELGIGDFHKLMRLSTTAGDR